MELLRIIRRNANEEQYLDFIQICKTHGEDAIEMLQEAISTIAEYQQYKWICILYSN